MLLTHITLGDVIVTSFIGITNQAVVRTVADNIQYRINLVDTNW